MPIGRREFVFHSAIAATAMACQAPRFIRSSDRQVVRQLPGRPSIDGAGVHLTRLIGQPDLLHLDPFILLDRIHSNDPAKYAAGFPNHPHRGFETVTVMLDGQMRHRDSRGNHGLITGGGAQWMTAGHGIVHSEMPEQSQGWLSGFQVWVNLPADHKMVAPYYQDLPPTELAEGRLSSAGTRLRLISGQVDGLIGPVRERPTQPLLLTAHLEDDHPVEISLPEHHAAWAFVAEGEAEFGPERLSTSVAEGSLVVFGPGSKLRLQARDQRSTLLVGGALPLGEPIVQSGPFVMNTDAEIQQAWADYRSGTLTNPA